MTLDTIIVDDEPLGRQSLLDLCAQQPDIAVVATCGSGPEALGAVRDLKPALVLLDVQMRPMNGLEVAKSLLDGDCPRIVFVTAFDRYAVRAFELNALDYLLKPVEPARFTGMVERVRRNRATASGADPTHSLKALFRESLDEWQHDTARHRNARLVVEDEGRVQFIDPGSVDCAEAQGNYVALHVGDQVHTVRATLTEIESRLPANRFLRLHRSVIVNTARIRSMERTFCGEFDVLLENRRHFRTGRTYRRQIQEFLLRTKSERP
jgi:two-component system LytT family response regulator